MLNYTRLSYCYYQNKISGLHGQHFPLSIGWKVENKFLRLPKFCLSQNSFVWIYYEFICKTGFSTIWFSRKFICKCVEFNQLMMHEHFWAIRVINKETFTKNLSTHSIFDYFKFSNACIVSSFLHLFFWLWSYLKRG